MNNLELCFKSLTFNTSVKLVEAMLYRSILMGFSAGCVSRVTNEGEGEKEILYFQKEIWSQ